MGVNSARIRLENLYTERAELVAFIASLYPSVLAKPSDAEDGFSYAVYIFTPEGQLSWHLADKDYISFADLEIVDENPWDGSSKDVVYSRLWSLKVSNFEKGLDKQ